MAANHLRLAPVVASWGLLAGLVVSDPGLPGRGRVVELGETVGLDLDGGVQRTLEGVVDALVPFSAGASQVLWGCWALGMLLVGALLCDIDSRSSTLGRYVPWRVPHHWLPHTYWFPAGLGLLGWVVASLGQWGELLAASLWWLTIGVLTHLWTDGRSRASVVGFYPLWPAWKTVTLGQEHTGQRLVVPRRRRGGYRVGTPEESRFVWLVVLVTVTAWAGWWFLLGRHWG